MPSENVPSETAEAWDRHSAYYQSVLQRSTDVASYGFDIGDESELRLLGSVAGKRVLELGCGGAHSSIAFAKQGATAIGVDVSGEQLAAARRLADREEVRLELHQGDLADLAFVRADTVDVVFSAHALHFVEDLNRVFRQVHRVLKTGGPFVFSIPHPVRDMIDDDSIEPLLIRRSYFDRLPLDYIENEIRFTAFHHTVSDIFMGLTRTGFRVDTLLEPEPRGGGRRSAFWRETLTRVPGTLVVRARKEGS